MKKPTGRPPIFRHEPLSLIAPPRGPKSKEMLTFALEPVGECESVIVFDDPQEICTLARAGFTGFINPFEVFNRVPLVETWLDGAAQ